MLDVCRGTVPGSVEVLPWDRCVDRGSGTLCEGLQDDVFLLHFLCEVWGLLVCTGLKQDDVTDSSEESRLDSGEKTLDVYSS